MSFRALQDTWTQAHDASMREALKAHPIIEEWILRHQKMAAHAVATGVLTDEPPAKQIQVIAHDKGRVSMTMIMLSDVDRLMAELREANSAPSRE